MKFKSLLLFSTFMLLNPITALSKEFTPESITHNNTSFERCDVFTFRYGFVIKVAEIAWYKIKCDEKNVLESETKILRFHYFKNVKADFFKESAEEYFLLNLNSDDRQKSLLEPMKKFNAGYTSIESGDYFQLTQIDTSKLSLFKNDEILVTTENADLAKNYFKIWFGKEPVIEKLKKAFQ